MDDTKVVDASEAAPEVVRQESEAGFEAGFKRVKGGEEKPAAKTDEAPPAEAPPITPNPVDARAKADAEAKAKADANAKFMDGLPGRIRNIEGHLGGMNSKIDQVLANAKKETQAAGKPAPTPAQVTAAQGSSERWKKLEQDFPDWAAAVNERIAAVGEEMAGKFPKVDAAAIKKEVMAGVAPMVLAARNEGRALALVDLKHEGWETTVNTKEFGDWLKTQSPEMQALADSKKAPDAIKLLDAYSEHTKALKKAEEERVRKEKRLAGAVTPVGMGQPGGAGGITDEQAFDRGFNRVRKGSK